MNSICIVKWGKTLSLCGVNSFTFFSFSFWLREGGMGLVRRSTMLLNVMGRNVYRGSGPLDGGKTLLPA